MILESSTTGNEDGEILKIKKQNVTCNKNVSSRGQRLKPRHVSL